MENEAVNKSQMSTGHLVVGHETVHFIFTHMKRIFSLYKGAWKRCQAQESDASTLASVQLFDTDLPSSAQVQNLLKLRTDPFILSSRDFP